MLCVTSLASCSGGIEKVCVMGIRDRIIYVDENKYELLLEKFKQKKKKNCMKQRIDRQMPVLKCALTGKKKTVAQTLVRMIQ